MAASIQRCLCYTKSIMTPVEPITPKRVCFVRDTPRVNMNYATLDVMQQNPLGMRTAGEECTATAIYHHPVGYDYYMEGPQDASGYLLSDCEEVVDAPPAPDPPMVYVTSVVDGIAYERLKTAPQKMYVRRPEGIDLVDFSGRIQTYRDFVGVPGTHLPYNTAVRIMGTAHYELPGGGQDFYIPQEPVNVWAEFTRTGHPSQLAGYRQSDLSDQPMPPIAKTVSTAKLVTDAVITSTSEPMTAVVPVKVKTATDYQFQYLRTDQQPVRYQVMHRLTAEDASGLGPAIEVPRGKTIKILGMFIDRGHTVLLPVLDNPDIPLFKYWYGIPEVDQGKRLVEVLPSYDDLKTTVPTPEEKEALGTARFTDHLVYYATKLEVAIERLFSKLKVVKGK
jgi:hypothetical protein